MRPVAFMVFVVSGVLALATARAQTVPVSDFESGNLSGWETRAFSGNTAYDIVRDNGRAVLRARTDGAASAIAREVNVDLARTPWLTWQWKVSGTYGTALPERTRAGDDYPARVYVVFSTGFGFWNTRAINYVWSSSQSVGASWSNAFTDKARMVVVASGEGRAGEWVTERRNVRADYERLFGEPAPNPEAVAIMTDGDNAGGSVTAWYADIRFLADPGAAGH